MQQKSVDFIGARVRSTTGSVPPPRTEQGPPPPQYSGVTPPSQTGWGYPQTRQRVPPHPICFLRHTGRLSCVQRISELSPVKGFSILLWQKTSYPKMSVRRVDTIFLSILEKRLISPILQQSTRCKFPLHSLGNSEDQPQRENVFRVCAQKSMASKKTNITLLWPMIFLDLIDFGQKLETKNSWLGLEECRFESAVILHLCEVFALFKATAYGCFVESLIHYRLFNHGDLD